MHYDENWVEARTRDLPEDLERGYGRRFDWDSAADLVRAYLMFRGADANRSWSEADREALASGAAMALLGRQYLPPSPTSTYGAPVGLAVALNAVLGLGIAALDQHRHHSEVPDAEDLREILVVLLEWLYPISDTCLDLAEAAQAEPRPQGQNLVVFAHRADSVAVDVGDDADVVVIEARHASRSAEMLARTAAHLESEYLSLPEHSAWMSTAAVCAGLSVSVDELRRATGAE